MKSIVSVIIAGTAVLASSGCGVHRLQSGPSTADVLAPVSQTVRFQQLFGSPSGPEEIVITARFHEPVFAYTTVTILWVGSGDEYEQFAYLAHGVDGGESRPAETWCRHFVADVNEDGIEDLIIVRFTEGYVSWVPDDSERNLGPFEEVDLYWVERAGKTPDYVYKMRLHTAPDEETRRRLSAIVRHRLCNVGWQQKAKRLLSETFRDVVPNQRMQREDR